MSSKPDPVKIQTTAGGVIRLWNDQISIEDSGGGSVITVSLEDEVKLRDALNASIEWRKSNQPPPTK